ncbi:MAG: methionyl-tRNA formyltransferase, partial [Deltaproteobacteria bacterium]|nr:methionyl-tRNA formyltransferase [Deltaproteobacteria bacterium]
MPTNPWTVVFLGTPEFACPSLAMLGESPLVSIPLVITQPDRPKGRGRKLTSPPVKDTARSLELPVIQPESIKSRELLDRLTGLEPDLLVVLAFGRLLPKPFLDIPRVGTVNVHPSLLPAWRGPAPVNWAVISGQTVTGVTTMFLDEGMDTGPILQTREVSIGPKETAGELENRLALIGAHLLLETIQDLRAGTIVPQKQPADGVSYGRLLTKEDGRLDWTQAAASVTALIRGLDPWPGAWTLFRGQPIRIFGAQTGPGQGSPGQILTLERNGLQVAAGCGSVCISEFQQPGKNRIPAAQFWHGQ